MKPVLSLFLTVMAATFASNARADNMPNRIVSVGGAVTEIIYALGAQDLIVAVDSTSKFPAEAGEKPDVGYMRALSPEGVLSMKPGMIIAIEGSGPKDALKVLEAASVPLSIVPNVYTQQGVIEKIITVAKLVGREKEGDVLIARVNEDFVTLKKQLAKAGAARRVMFALSIQSGRIMVAGRETSAAAIIELAGAKNVFKDFKGYKPVSAEAIIAAAPDVIVMMERGGGGHARRDEILSLPAIKATPAGANKKLVAMNGLYLLGFGPRTAQAARSLADALAGK